MVIYLECVSVSFGRCELQSLHFPSVTFFLPILCSHFFLNKILLHRYSSITKAHKTKEIHPSTVAIQSN